MLSHMAFCFWNIISSIISNCIVYHLCKTDFYYPSRVGVKFNECSLNNGTAKVHDHSSTSKKDAKYRNNVETTFSIMDSSQKTLSSLPEALVFLANHTFF